MHYDHGMDVWGLDAVFLSVEIALISGIRHSLLSRILMFFFSPVFGFIFC